VIDSKDSAVVYKVNGSFTSLIKGNWQLKVNIPIREEFESLQSKSLKVLFPDTLICNSDTIPLRNFLKKGGSLEFHLEETGSVKKNHYATYLNCVNKEFKIN